MPRQSTHLLDLHQNLLVDICRVLSIRDKLQLRLVCKSFQSLLDKPAPGSGIWGVVDLYAFKNNVPAIELYWWLLKRAAGIQSLQHIPHEPDNISCAIEILEKDVNKQLLITRTLPRLAKVLPQGAEVLLDLRWVNAQCLFAREQAPHNPEYMLQYWGALSTCLTKLKLAFKEDIAAATSSALSQLTQLRGLVLEGASDYAAIINLRLPKLTKLTLHDFGKTTVSLACPQLKSLKLFSLNPLQKMSRLPKGLEHLRLSDLAAGSVPFEHMIPAQGLKHLSKLTLLGCPGNPIAVREAYGASKLVDLSMDHPWAPLLPTQPPWQGLPYQLQDVELWHPLDDGIPLVLEQLSNLQTLTIEHVGEGPVHLTRPLDPFLDMSSFQGLYLYSDKNEDEDLDRWTPAALGFLGLADKRILDMASVPGGRSIELCQQW